MTRDDFIAKYKALDLKMKKGLIFFFFAFLILVIITGLPLIYFKSGASIIQGVLAIDSVLGITILIMVTARLQKELSCPNCRRSLHGFSGQRVLNTSKCPHCGQIVIES